MLSPSTSWSIYGGVHAAVVGVVLLLLISPVSDALGTLLGVPTGHSAFLLAAPVPFLGAVVWWVLVERRESYTYASGATGGVPIALATVLFWALVFVAVRGFASVIAGVVLVGFAVVMSVPAALPVGIPLMYTRRRPIDGVGKGRAPVPQ